MSQPGQPGIPVGIDADRLSFRGKVTEIPGQSDCLTDSARHLRGALGGLGILPSRSTAAAKLHTSNIDKKDNT